MPRKSRSIYSLTGAGAVFLLLLCPQPLVAQPSWSAGAIEKFFPNLNGTQLQTLHSGEGVTNFYDEDMELDFAPSIDRWDSLHDDLVEFDPSVGIETIFLLPLSQIEDAGQSAEQFRLRVYNTLRRVSTMEGVRYYSESRDRMRIFYEESYTIRGGDDRTRTPDQTVTQIPDRATIHIFQHDSSFGSNVYRAVYYHDDGTMTLSLVNLTRLYYRSIFPVVAPNNLRIKISIVPTDEGLVFYGNSAIDVITLLGMDDRVRDSFYNRVVALFGWFSDQL